MVAGQLRDGLPAHWPGRARTASTTRYLCSTTLNSTNSGPDLPMRVVTAGHSVE